MEKDYRWLFFDLDGTLTDPGEGITRSVQYALRSFGIEVEDRTALYPFIGPPLADSFREFYGFGREDSLRAVEKYHEYFRRQGIFENRLYPGMDRLLENVSARGYGIAMATSKPAVFARRIAEHFGIARHFDFICQGVTQGITQLQIQWNMPVAFGILTVNDQQQAFDRAGGKYGNKGNEAAAAAIQMVKLQTDMEAASPNTVPDRKNIN